MKKTKKINLPKPLKISLDRNEVVSNWVAFPSLLRGLNIEQLVRLGLNEREVFDEEYLRIRNRTELAEFLGISRRVLYDVEHADKVQKLIKEKKKQWGGTKTPNVFLALYRGIIKHGDAARTKLWLEYFEEFIEKSQINIPELQETADAIKEIAEQFKK